MLARELSRASSKRASPATPKVKNTVLNGMLIKNGKRKMENGKTEGTVASRSCEHSEAISKQSRAKRSNQKEI